MGLIILYNQLMESIWVISIVFRNFNNKIKYINNQYLIILNNKYFLETYFTSQTQSSIYNKMNKNQYLICLKKNKQIIKTVKILFNKEIKLIKYNNKINLLNIIK